MLQLTFRRIFEGMKPNRFSSYRTQRTPHPLNRVAGDLRIENDLHICPFRQLPAGQTQVALDVSLFALVQVQRGQQGMLGQGVGFLNFRRVEI